MVSPISPQKSPTYPQNSPTYPQKSQMSPQKYTKYPQQKPTISAKEPYISTKSPICSWTKMFRAAVGLCCACVNWYNVPSTSVKEPYISRRSPICSWTRIFLIYIMRQVHPQRELHSRQKAPYPQWYVYTNKIKRSCYHFAQAQHTNVFSSNANVFVFCDVFPSYVAMPARNDIMSPIHPQKSLVSPH